MSGFARTVGARKHALVEPVIERSAAEKSLMEANTDAARKFSLGESVVEPAAAEKQLLEANTDKQKPIPPPKKQVQLSLKQVKKAAKTVVGQTKASAGDGILQVAGHFDFGLNRAPRRAGGKRKPRRRTPLFGGPT